MRFHIKRQLALCKVLKNQSVSRLFIFKKYIILFSLLIIVLIFYKPISDFLKNKITSFLDRDSVEVDFGQSKIFCIEDIKKYISNDDVQFKADVKQQIVNGTRWSNVYDKSVAFAIEKGYSTQKKEALLNYAKQQYIKQTNDFIWQVNTKYRFCLADKGLTPIDLFSKIDDVNNDSIDQAKIKIPSGNEVNQMETNRIQQCQQDIAKYNTCLNEYNINLEEYNTCINNSGSICGFKPYNSCFKPFCF